MFNSMLGGLYHWDGSTWNWLGYNIQLGGGPQVQVLDSDSSALFSNGRNDLYLAMFDLGGSFATVVLHYDGSSWTRELVGAGTRPLGLCGQTGRGLWLVGGDPPGMGGSASVLYHPLP